MQILIIQTAFIGDVILATALIEKLKAYHPDAKIDFLLRKGNEILLDAHPHLREVLVWDKQGGKWRNLFRLLASIRKVRYDLLVNVQRFASSGLLTAFSRAKVKVGFAKNPFSRFFTHSYPHVIDNGTHETARNQQLIAAWTDALPARPRLYPPIKYQEQVKKLQGKALANPYICVAPTSVWFTKQWAEDKWIAFLKQVPAKYIVYLLGAPTDTAVCERIKEQVVPSSNIINLAGKLPLLASAYLMQGAKMNYVNDSAPMHLASAMNAPTCAIFCSTVPSFGYTPLADINKVVQVQEDLPCRPCGLHGHKACPEKHFKCAQNIAIQELLDLLM